LGHNLNKWKISFFVCLVAFIATCVLLIYNTIDLGVSYTYLEQSYDEKSQANEVLGNLIVKGGKEYSQQDFLYLLRKEYPKELIVEDGNIIKIGWNMFVFKDGKLVEAH
jgi:hypothetical protein